MDNHGLSTKPSGQAIASTKTATRSTQMGEESFRRIVGPDRQLGLRFSCCLLSWCSRRDYRGPIVTHFAGEKQIPAPGSSDYVGSGECARCHQEIYGSYLRTSHGTLVSASLPNGSKTIRHLAPSTMKTTISDSRSIGRRQAHPVGIRDWEPDGHADSS